MACCDRKACPSNTRDPRYRRVLWAALLINAGMFGTELLAGLAAGSVSLQADALDFLSDAANYGISLSVVGLPLFWRARAALVKGASMGLFGSWVAANTVYHAASGTLPQAEVMGVIGFLALAANGCVALMLYRYRAGDANMRSVWICSRNDALGNIAVLLAALGVFGMGTGWPDLAVASIMATLALWGAVQIIVQARGELRHEGAQEPGRLGPQSSPISTIFGESRSLRAKRSDPGLSL